MKMSRDALWLPRLRRGAVLAALLTGCQDDPLAPPLPLRMVGLTYAPDSLIVGAHGVALDRRAHLDPMPARCSGHGTCRRRDRGRCTVRPFGNSPRGSGACVHRG